MKQSDQKLIHQHMAQFWTNNVPFNQLLGFEIVLASPEKSEIHFKWNDKLVGNTYQKILHGGVISSALDLAGGAVAASKIVDQLDNFTPDVISEHLETFGTIDMRTDFLRPGRGKEFIATAYIIRIGNKVAVTRMELHNEENTHIAFGTATYMVG